MPTLRASSNASFSSFRGRLALLVISVLLPVLLLSAVMVAFGYRQQRAGVGGHLLNTARALAGTVDRHFHEMHVVLRTAAASEVLAHDDVAAFERMARRAVVGTGQAFVLCDAHYRTLCDTGAPDASAPDFDDPQMRAAMSAGRPYISNIISGSGDRLLVRASLPYKRGDDIAYTLHLVTEVPGLAKLLAVDRCAGASLISIVDRQARIAARTREPEKYLGKYASSNMQSLLAASADGVRDTVTLDGVPVVTAFARARSSEWVVIVAASRSTLLASAQRLAWLALGLSAGVTLMVGGVAFWIGRGMARGVDGLVAASEAIGRGTKISPQPTGLAEIDIVAAALERSAAQLEESAAEARAALAQEKAARVASQQAVDRLSFSLSALNLGEWEWQADADALRFSPRTAAIHGLDPKKNYTRGDFLKTITPEDVDRVWETVKRAESSGIEYQTEYRVSHPVLGVRWVAARGKPVFTSEGALTGMIGVVQDVTDQRLAEMVLRTQNELLEQRVAERTRQLNETIEALRRGRA